MTQSISKSGLILGYHTIQEAFVVSAKVFQKSSLFRIKPKQMAAFNKGMSVVIIDLMGDHADILNLDPDRDAYFKWAKDVIMLMILPILNSCEMKE